MNTVIRSNNGSALQIVDFWTSVEFIDFPDQVCIEIDDSSGAPTHIGISVEQAVLLREWLEERGF